jgi:hypothetical protein
MTRSKRKEQKERPDRKRSSPGESASEGSEAGPILALLEVDPDGNVSDEEIRHFMREPGLPENKD